MSTSSTCHYWRLLKRRRDRFYCLSACLRAARCRQDLAKVPGCTTGKRQFILYAAKQAMEAQPQRCTGAEKCEAATHVDVEAALGKETLEGLPTDNWPKPALTNALAADLAKLRKSGQKQPFIAVDLEKYLPGWAVCRDQEEDAQPSSGKKACTLTISQWVASFSRWVRATRRHAMQTHALWQVQGGSDSHEADERCSSPCAHGKLPGGGCGYPLGGLRVLARGAR